MVTGLFSTFDSKQFSQDKFMVDLILEKRVDKGTEIYEAYETEFFFANVNENFSSIVLSATKKELLTTISFEGYKNYKLNSTKLIDKSV